MSLPLVAQFSGLNAELPWVVLTGLCEMAFPRNISRLSVSASSGKGQKVTEKAAPGLVLPVAHEDSTVALYSIPAATDVLSLNPDFTHLACCLNAAQGVKV